MSNNIGERYLPETISLFHIEEDGSVTFGAGPTADVYIEESDMYNFSDPIKMTYVREKYGDTIGVMQDTEFRITPKFHHNDMMLVSI